MKDQFKIES